jgi:hypothetical protein
MELFPLGIKRQRPEADHSNPSNAVYVMMALCVTH